MSSIGLPLEACYLARVDPCGRI